MKVETQDKEIGGVRLTTTKLPPTRAYVLSPKLLRVVGPAMGAVTAAMGGRLQEASINTDNLAEGLLKYSDAERLELMLSVLASTIARVDAEFVELTSEAAINRAFPDFYAVMEALVWVIKFNFFPSGIAALVEALRAKAKANPST